MSNAARVTHCGVDGGRDSREVTQGQSTGVDISNGKGFKSNPQNGCNPSIPHCLPAGNVDAKRDLLLPSDQLWTWNRSDAVKLRTDSKQTVPKTVMTSFKETAHKFANHPALAVKVDGVWKKWTYQEYYGDVWKAAKALIRLGLERHNGVGIIGFNSPEWFIADLATIFAGGFATGIYATNSPEACRYIAHNAQCNVIFVEDDHQLQKILQVRTQLPHLKVIVQYKGQPNKTDGNIYSWEEFMQFSEGIPDAVLQKIIDDQAVNQCCSLIYTSGTTGNPKGVMMSHDNLMWTANHSVEMVSLVEGEDTVVSYLPLSHIAAQILDIFIPVTHAATIYFAQPDALKGSLGETLKEVRPTIFFGVPRVWEKMQAKMTSVVSRQSHMKQVIANWAYKIGLKGSLAKMNHRGTKPAGWSIANRLVFAKVRAALGLDKCHHFLTAAAPIAKETLEFFYSLDMIILELFGMSETSGPHTISTHTAFRIGSVGPVHQDSPVVILNKDADGNGEIGLSGRNMFMGYLNEEEKTKETFESNGYVRSGDIGRIDESGFLYITGRIKELLITAGGENIAPVPIEDAVKAALPQCVSNCMLVGDKQKFLSLLITLKTEVDAETSEPLDKLSPHTLAWCQSVGSHATCVSQIISNEGDDHVIAAIQAGIDEANKKAVSRAQHIQKWSIVPRDFSLSGGELGPTLKLRRHVVTEMYKDTINALYTREG